MEWTISYLPEQQIAIIETQGVADDVGSLEMAKAIFKTMQENNTLRCLIDHSRISSASGNVSRVYYRPRELRGVGVPANIKIAEVVQPEHDAHFSFFETVSHNQGLNLRVFRDRESAMHWLMK